MQIEVLTEAKNDLIDGAKFYASQSNDLAKYFLDSLWSDIESLHMYCGVHIKIQNYYRLLSKRFPYAIYYQFNQNTIYIYAVLDCRSNPKNIKSRLI